MSEFNLKFRGIRGSYPLANNDFLKYGGNTACIEVNVGGHLIILDAGSGLISLGDELMQQYISSNYIPQERQPIVATILLSHIHQDHIQGFTFFRPMHLASTTLNVFGQVANNTTLADELSEILFGKSFPLDLKDIKAKLNIKNITDEQTIILRHNCAPIIMHSPCETYIDDVLIQCYKSYAHPKDGVSIYKITYKNKSLVYATDKESYLGGDKKLIDFARNCNILIHDAQYTTEDYLDQYSPKQGYGHSTFDMAIEIQRKTNSEKLVFFHLDPSYNDEKIDRLKEQYCLNENIIMAQENLEIEL